MAEDELKYATNAELSLKLDKLKEKFEDKKSIMAKAYQDMMALHEEYMVVKELFDKRTGNTNAE